MKQVYKCPQPKCPVAFVKPGQLITHLVLRHHYSETKARDTIPTTLVGQPRKGR